MHNSSSSTPPSIKVQHRAAKKRAIRRRRIDLQCGCSIFVHIDCAGHGFTHRGTHHCTSGREWRVYLGNIKSPLFQDVQRRGHTIHEDQSLPRPNTVQPQPEESTGSPQGLSQLPNLDDIPESFWDDIFK
ncbi:transactivating protein [Tomato chlorotic mottle virus]|uniref:Transcriptional activator protein n=1 Tax=Tomato chlorotic mottle virus TaxID=172391 RepID=M4QW87_9GEMI|nr:transactivating protein [Tomato chlorotic mottle virus]AGH29651.1 transactivating protein [Tomato chlorotic mottle virus]AGH29656.1 transactivating protein [Tomato chlorotic mottle virus]AGH29661.1 transactivating protein [Tomato chlorotic mottle virus]AGH29666.1 transactivating protein [Tomato chlorotic mottle virus]